MRSAALFKGISSFCIYRCSSNAVSLRPFCSQPGEELLESLMNHEKTGIADGAGTTGPAGFDLGVMHTLLHAMGNPQVGLPVVQIVGTKGKGSVTAMLSAMLQNAGYTVGSYTSPHLISLRERIAVNNKPIGQDDFDSLVAASLGQAAAARGLQSVSHFEMMTAVAVKHFTSQKVDVAVMEAGLGGGHDATNVFDPEQILATVVTAIDVEHLDALGGTLQSIANAKAGIIKPGCPVVIGHQTHDIAKQIICQRASDLNCRLYDEQAVLMPGRLAVTSHGASQANRVFVLNGEMGDVSEDTEVVMLMVGEHQRHNAITAISAALALRRRGFLNLTVKTILGGLQTAQLPGRFQVGRLKHAGDEGEGVDGDPGGSSPWLVLDAAHTAASAAALAKTLREAFPEGRHRLAFVLAMSNDKDYSAVCTALRAAKPVAISFTTVPIANSNLRCAPPGALIASWQTAGFAESRPARMRETIQASLAAAVMKAEAEVGESSDGVICVTGSVHAVAAALQQDLLMQT